MIGETLSCLYKAMQMATHNRSFTYTPVNPIINSMSLTLRLLLAMLIVAEITVVPLTKAAASEYAESNNPHFRPITAHTGTRFTQTKDTSGNRETPLVEEFSFLIKDFRMNHQSEVQNLNIIIRFSMSLIFLTKRIQTSDCWLKM